MIAPPPLAGVCRADGPVNDAPVAGGLRLDAVVERVDGVPLTIRPIRPDDAGRELAFLEGLSRATRYQRLLSARRLLPGELRRLVRVDLERDMALVATEQLAGVEVQVGVARYVRLQDPTRAEFGIVVADAWQRRGLGERLMRHLLDAASDHRLAALTGIALSENAGMLCLARRLGARLRLEAGDATVTRIDLALRAFA